LSNLSLVVLELVRGLTCEFSKCCTLSGLSTTADTVRQSVYTS